MTGRDWFVLGFFVAAAVAAAVTVALILSNGSGGHGSTPPGKRQIGFCYPNQGTAAC